MSRASLSSFCLSRRPRSDAQGVCDEADRPVPEASRDVSRQAPLTHTHTGPIVPNVLHSYRLHTEIKSKAQGHEMLHVCSKIYHTMDAHFFYAHWSETNSRSTSFAQLNKNQNTVNAFVVQWWQKWFALCTTGDFVNKCFLNLNFGVLSQLSIGCAHSQSAVARLHLWVALLH